MDDVRRRIGRRGAYLLASAALYAIYGWSLVSWPRNRPVAEVYDVLTRLLPISGWGWAWIITSAVCSVMAFTFKDRAGFTLLSLMVGCWAIGTLFGAAFSDQPRAFVIGCVFVAMAVKHVIVSGMEERRRASG